MNRALAKPLLLLVVVAHGCARDHLPTTILRSGQHHLHLFDPSTPPTRSPGWPIVWNRTTDAELPTLRARSTPIEISGIAEFDEALVSWNIDLPDSTNAGVTIECRVQSDRQQVPSPGWTPFLELGTWGAVPESRNARYEFERSKVATDVLQSKGLFNRIEVRLNAFSEQATLPLPNVERVAISLSRIENVSPHDHPPVELSRLSPRLPVPFRSQRSVPEIGHRICSPTSTSMVLAYRGVDVPTAEFASRAYDAAHDIYGNWPRNVQAAYSLGVPGYLTRFGDWPSVERTLASGQPLVISVRAREGELRGAPYPSTKGHLLVVCGFDDNGNVEVNDPAASSPEAGRIAYRRQDLETVWFGRGGVAYVFLPSTP